MSKRGRKTTKAKDDKGYLDSNKDAFTDYKVIQGNKITMEGVSGKIYAIPIDNKGQAGVGRLMKAGENHTFDGAAHVIEVPEVAMARLGLNTDPTKPTTGSPELQAALQQAMSQNRGYVPNIGTTPAMDFVNQPLNLGRPSEQDIYYNDVNQVMKGQPQAKEQDAYLQSVEPQRAVVEPLQLDWLEKKKQGVQVGATPQELLQESATTATSDLEKKYTETEDEDKSIQPTQRIQFDNPYGGVDIPTAAQTLGASLSYDGDMKGANTARGLASGLKLLTGLGRNVMSGYAQNKRNQWVTDEFNEDQKRAMRGTTQMQQGGNISASDLTSINESTGVDFTSEGANSLFDHVPMDDPQQVAAALDFGKYKDVGYFEEGEMQNGKRTIYNTSKNPMNFSDNNTNALRYLQERNDPESFVFKYRDSKARNPQPVQGLASRQKGGRVSAAELLTGSVITGDPTVVPNVETEDGEHIKDNQTGKVQEVIGKKHSQGGEQMQLEDHKVLSDYTKIGGSLAKKYRDEYDVNVKAKDTYATVMDKVLKKTGYKSITDELTSVIEKTEKEQEKAKDRENQATSGINKQFLSGKIHNLTKELEPLEQLKSTVFETLFEDQQGSKPKSEIETEMMEMAEGGDTTEDDNKRISRERFKQFANTARRLGYKGEINVNATNLDAEAAKLQAFMVKNHPQIAADYAKKNRITAKGLGELKESYPYLFEQAGLDINKEPSEYSDDELAKLTSVATEQDVVDDKFWLDQFQDGLWRYRAPNVSMTYGMDIAPRVDTNRPLNITADLLQAPNGMPETGDAKDAVEGVSQSEARKRNTGTGNSTLLLPDQHILPPSAMQPHRLGEITPREAEAKLISPNAQLEEINRQAMSAKAEINNLPDSSRRAALAQLNAQTQQSINQVMAQTNRTNAQIEGQVDAQNIQRASQADILNEQYAEGHEMKQLKALDNTEQDIRNYFNAQNKKQVANYNTVQNLNLTNAMYDNFQYTGSGQVIQTGKGLDKEDIALRMKSMGYNQEEIDEALNNKKSTKKTTTAKRGRKTK